MEKEFTPAERVQLAAAILRELGVTNAYLNTKELFVVDGDNFKAIIGDAPVQKLDRNDEKYPNEYSTDLADGWRIYSLNYEKDE